MKHEKIISRHRLPRRYRIALAALWVCPTILFVFAILLSRGFTSTLLDLRVLVFLAIMLLPALYVWHEGVDVLPSGIIARVFWPRYYPFSALDNWYFDSRSDRHILTIWNVDHHKVFECRAGHLTNLPFLLAILKNKLRYRHWPS